LQAVDQQAGSWARDRALVERDLLYRRALEFLDAPRYRDALD
jgi:hypothetical protein